MSWLVRLGTFSPHPLYVLGKDICITGFFYIFPRMYIGKGYTSLSSPKTTPREKFPRFGDFLTSELTKSKVLTNDRENRAFDGGCRHEPS